MKAAELGVYTDPLAAEEDLGAYTDPSTAEEDDQDDGMLTAEEDDQDDGMLRDLHNNKPPGPPLLSKKYKIPKVNQDRATATNTIISVKKKSSPQVNVPSPAVKKPGGATKDPGGATKDPDRATPAKKPKLELGHQGGTTEVDSSFNSSTKSASTKYVSRPRDGVPLFDDPTLPPGWSRVVSQRTHGISAGAWDAYIFHGTERFRSRQDIRRYFERTGETNLDWRTFDFNPFGSKKQHEMNKAQRKKDSQAVSNPAVSNPAVNNPAVNNPEGRICPACASSDPCECDLNFLEEDAIPTSVKKETTDELDSSVETIPNSSAESDDSSAKRPMGV